jgi:protein SCO1/2
VITISISSKETIGLALKKKASYLETMKTKSADRFWQFYVTDSLAVKTLTEAAGWKFKKSGNDYIHSAATILLTPKRKIGQYFYGTFILPMHFHMAVQDARNEITGASRLKDQKYCYNFTPGINRYYSLIVSASGIVILLFAVILFIWLSLKPGPGK